MAVSDVVLGLIIERPDHRRSLVRRYQKHLPLEELSRQLDEFNPFERSADGEQARSGRLAERPSSAAADVDAAIAANVEDALASLREQALIELAAKRGNPVSRRGRDAVYLATPAGFEQFEWWMGDASTLDAQGLELRRKVVLSRERHLPRLLEQADVQELLFLERLEELRGSGERMTFARCTTLEELWEALGSLKEPMCMQGMVEWVREMRVAIAEELDARVEQEHNRVHQRARGGS